MPINGNSAVDSIEAHVPWPRQASKISTRVFARALREASSNSALFLGHAGALETTGLERRTLELRGKDQTVDAWVVTARREP